jgi:hypothetical protein
MRSLHASEGVLLYSLQSVFATAVAPAETLGIAEYNATDDGDFRQFFTVGKKNLHKNKAGNAKVDWQVRLNGLGSPDLLALGVRTSGQVPWITWGFGSDAVDASPEAWQVQDSKCDTLECSLDGGGILTASLQGIGGQKSTLTTLTADPGDDNPFFSYEAICTLAGSAFELKGFRFTVNHNLTPEYVIRGTSVSSARRRLWDYLTEGNEEISGSVILARKYSKDFQALCPAADGDLVLTLTEACDALNTFAITLEDVEFLSQARNMPADGYGTFELPFNAKGWSVA